MNNLDAKTVASFGRQWTRFDQELLSEEESRQVFDQYFFIFPWDSLPADGGVGVDVGCGSGRWARRVAPRVRRLHLVDASPTALAVAQSHLADFSNLVFHAASVDAMPVPAASCDFAYSLGVLHHLPDTGAAIRSVANVLRPGAPFLIYLYPSLENRPWWYRLLANAGDRLRDVVSRAPSWFRFVISDLVAAVVYFPLARTAAWLEKQRRLPTSWPLAYYRHRSFYVMRTDALDRLGNPMVKKFSRREIETMLASAGLEDIQFSPNPPYWCAVARRAGAPPVSGIPSALATA